METGGEVTKNMILAVVNMVEHEYDYVGSGKQMWEESCGAQSQVALGSARPGLLSPAGTMSAADYHLLVITLKTAAPHSPPPASPVSGPLLSEFVQVSMLPPCSEAPPLSPSFVYPIRRNPAQNPHVLGQSHTFHH